MATATLPISVTHVAATPTVTRTIKVHIQARSTPDIPAHIRTPDRSA